MLDVLLSAKNVLLIEPDYYRKYVPLGLAKVSALVKQNGGETTFARGYVPGRWDAVAVTSLFTYDSGNVVDAVNQVRENDPGVPIVIGGVYATLMAANLENRTGVKPYIGWSKELDMVVPDYTLDWQTQDDWGDFAYIFTTRGCPNSCAYCTVPRIEPEYWINPNWRDILTATNHPNVMIQDNNIAAAPREHLIGVLRYLVGSGRGVYFDGGFDCKYVTPEMARYVARMKIWKHGVRLAFDRIEDESVFQEAASTLIRGGVSCNHILAYVLFNFTDTPQEANYRATEIMRLGIRPYPQRYTPLTYTTRERKFVGKHWTERLIKAWRYFWLMQGHYRTKTFEQWMRTEVDDTHPIEALQEEDWEAWRKV